MHVTVRMAWHDHGWDGKVCRDPSANTYCTGTHSLLSERLAREKSVDPKREAPGANLDAALPEYLPPCFWSSCAFADHPTSALHRHPFGYLRDKKQINARLRPYSVYTWPFRLSMTHKASKRYGQYFPDLESRIDRYCARLVKDKSLIFFYLNYDNPISADEYRYAVVGCARLSQDPELSGHFPFDETELQEIRSGEGMKNFPTLNWAIQLTHQGAGTFVRLPYQEYLEYIADHPEAESQLEEIRVLIEEPALLPGFKYVSEQVNDDHALALLYKLKRAFAAVQKHGIADGDNEMKILDQYIEETWANRGLYPGLGSVVSVLADLSEGQPQKENTAGQMLVDAIRYHQGQGDDILDVTFGLLEGRGALPTYLANHKNTVRDAKAGLRDNKVLLPALRKLSLFALTPRQVARILYADTDGSHAFGGRIVTVSDLVANPYLLSESYVPSTDAEDENNADLDREQRTDSPIDYFTVDVGMFPDKRYLERNDQLQDLTVAGPERLRAFALEALNRNEALGHSFAPLDVLVEEAGAHPLFYKDSIALSDRQFLSDEHLAHFRQRMFVKEYDGRHFFYLQETKDTEDIIARFITERLDLPDLSVKSDWLGTYLDKQAAELTTRISGFNAEGFKTERCQLMEDALQRRIYCITGRPGSGKTQALHSLLDHLGQMGESAIVLAPTGKAALRLGSSAQSGTEWKAETIDHWIFRSGLGSYLGGRVSLNTLSRSDRFQPTDNVVLDEMSMMDLGHLALLFRALEVHQPGSIKRVILVGDENQLPPIGCGRPFYDIISYFREDAAREKRNMVRLTTNCRQQHDPVVLNAAYLFAGKNRYHTDLYDRMLAGGNISLFLNVQYWESPKQLQDLVADFIDSVLGEAVPDRDKLSPQQAFNLLLRLYDNGFVPNNDTGSLALDRVQLLTPYRGGPSGSLGLSDFTRRRYRQEAWPERTYKNTAFAHSDKLIRISNWYGWNSAEKRMELRLSNGSVGVLCNNKKGRKAYFPESDWPVDWRRMKEDDFELAYSITVHKAQGSEFQEVLVVLPERRALLSRELVYTALTRSKTKLTLLIQKTPRLNPLQVARDRSVLLGRNSSIFAEPFDSRRIFEPEPGKKVKSKIEYLIYRELQHARDAGRLTFEYEEGLELPIGGRSVSVKPDFTIRCGGKTFYWEHLGMLDRADYSHDWRERVAGYKTKKLADVLLTTDDLAGVRQERLKQVIADLTRGEPGGDGGQEFSLHHYRL
jgi:exodeoxyribonuclease V alpha subunit